MMDQFSPQLHQKNGRQGQLVSIHTHRRLFRAANTQPMATRTSATLINNAESYRKSGNWTHFQQPNANLPQSTYTTNHACGLLYHHIQRGSTSHSRMSLLLREKSGQKQSSPSSQCVVLKENQHQLPIIFLQESQQPMKNPIRRTVRITFASQCSTHTHIAQRTRRTKPFSTTNLTEKATGTLTPCTHSGKIRVPTHSHHLPTHALENPKFNTDLISAHDIASR